MNSSTSRRHTRRNAIDDHSETGRRDESRHGSFQEHSTASIAANSHFAGRASACFCARRSSYGGRIRESGSLHRKARAENRRQAQRGCIDVGIARVLDAHLPSQQRQQRSDRDDCELAWAVLADEFAAYGKWRIDRALADPGPALFVDCWVKDQAGKPIADAEVDVWHSSPEGFYEQQDPRQAPMNLRGKFMTDARGHFSFRSVKPAGYPIPIDGPVGDLVRATGRHNYRPAHLHFLIFKEGFKTLISQVYVNDDERLETDVQFGVTRALVGNYIRHSGPAP